MNLATKIYLSATKTAIELPPDANVHEQDAAALEAFKVQGFDPLDYAIWRFEFNRGRQSIAAVARQKAPSENKPATAPAAKPPTPAAA